jgi:hypothetical protein
VNAFGPAESDPVVTIGDDDPDLFGARIRLRAPFPCLFDGRAQVLIAAPRPATSGVPCRQEAGAWQKSPGPIVRNDRSEDRPGPSAIDQHRVPGAILSRAIVRSPWRRAVAERGARWWSKCLVSR